jgi:hypothetical protein
MENMQNLLFSKNIKNRNFRKNKVFRKHQNFRKTNSKQFRHSSSENVN